MTLQWTSDWETPALIDHIYAKQATSDEKKPMTLMTQMNQMTHSDEQVTPPSNLPSSNVMTNNWEHDHLSNWPCNWVYKQPLPPNIQGMTTQGCKLPRKKTFMGANLQGCDDMHNISTLHHKGVLGI